jgi:hypothetical protein
MNPVIEALLPRTEALLKLAVGSTVTYFLKRTWDDRFFGVVRGQRRALVGDWRGTIIQERPGGSPLEIPLSITFKAGTKRVVGKAEADNPNQPLLKLDFTGGFVFDQLVRLDYRSPDKNVIQFGSYIARLDAGGRTLTGYYSGYGPMYDRVVYGSATLTKVDRAST